jgi:hypothetical protein
MKAIDSRIRRLQNEFCPENGQQRLWFTNLAGGELALDLDSCAEILDECGFLPKGRFCIVNLCGVPDGLNAKELEKFLRKNGAQTCAGNEKPGGPEAAGQRRDSSCSSQAQIASDCVRC